MMLKKVIVTFVLLSNLFLSNVEAQDFDAMIQQQLQQGAALSNQMQQMENGIVQQNMNNPEVQRMYQQHLASGGRMSFEQFAYGYAATRGYSQDGMDYYNQNEQDIQRREGAAVDAYRQNQANNARAMQDMHARNNEIAHYRGNTLSGTTDFTDPSTGQQYNLPHTMQPGDRAYDYGSGDQFYNGPGGSYYREDDSGYAYELEMNQ